MQQPVLVCVDDGLYTVTCADLAVETLHVRLDGALPHEQAGGDLVVAASTDQQLEHIELPVGEIDQLGGGDGRTDRAGGDLGDEPASDGR